MMTRQNVRLFGGRNLPGTVVRENRQIHLPDLDHVDPEMADWPGPPVARRAGVRTMVGTPLRTHGRAIGALVVYRNVLQPFQPAELQLLQSFADQAVIAIENARLLDDLRQRTDDLSESLEQQTAASEVLQIISSSPGDLDPVFASMLENRRPHLRRQHRHHLSASRATRCGSARRMASRPRLAAA